MKKRIILKRLLLSTAVLTVTSTAIIVQQYNSADKTVKTEECSKQDVVSNSAEPKIEKSAVSKPVEEAKVEQPVFSKPVQEAKAEQPVVTKPVEEAKAESPVLTTPVEQPKAETSVEQTKPVEATTPKVEESVVSEKGEALVQPTLPEFHDAKGQPEVQPALTELIVPAENPQPEQPTAKVEEKIVSEKGEPLVQPELPEYHEAKGQPEVQPALTELVVPTENTQPEQPVVPEAPIVTEKGEPLVQPELPEFHAENGTPEVQPELPEFHAENGDALVQPELPEFHSENGTPEVQPELPEFHAETGDALVQPELPEYHESKGEPEVQPALPEFKLKTVSREETIKIPAVTMNVPNSELNEGETEIVTQPKEGSITRTYEDVLDEHDNVLSTKLVNETRVEAINGVTSIGTKPVKKVFGETGMYRFSEHLSDEKILEFREDVKLTADEIHALGQDEINKRAEQNLENTITVQDKQRLNLSHMDSAPLSDETINNLNGDTYINHKNIGLKVLELVNAERKRLGIHELTWSDPLYTLTKIRANEVRENGSIRFYTEEGKTLKHVRDDKGTPWYTVRDNTEFKDSALGENLAGYSIRPNIYKAFSEKYIADQLYNQWKNSPGHYANMIKEKYNRFAFDVAYSKFLRDGHTDVTYKKQGVLGVQLFADEGY